VLTSIRGVWEPSKEAIHKHTLCPYTMLQSWVPSATPFIGMCSFDAQLCLSLSCDMSGLRDPMAVSKECSAYHAQTRGGDGQANATLCVATTQNCSAQYTHAPLLVFIRSPTCPAMGESCISDNTRSFTARKSGTATRLPSHHKPSAFLKRRDAVSHSAFEHRGSWA
jgi:hypothetical protein